MIELTPEIVAAALKADEFFMHASTNFDGVAHLSIVIEASLTDTTSSRDIDATDYEWVLSADNDTLAELCRRQHKALRELAEAWFGWAAIHPAMSLEPATKADAILALWPDDPTEMQKAFDDITGKNDHGLEDK